MLLDRDRADRYLRDLGIDAVVATSPTNVTYVTDYRCWLAPIMRDYMVSPGASSALAHRDFAVLPLGENPVLVVDALMAANAGECWVRDIEPAGPGGFELPDGAPGPFAEDLERIAAILLRERGNETAVDALRLGDRSARAPQLAYRARARRASDLDRGADTKPSSRRRDPRLLEPVPPDQGGQERRGALPPRAGRRGRRAGRAGCDRRNGARHQPG